MAANASTDRLLRSLEREHLEHGLPLGLRELAERFIYTALGLLFPHFATQPHARHEELAGELYALGGILDRALGESDAGRAATVEHFYSRLAWLREALLLDATAIYEGDPAAESLDEVILAYPGFLAIASYRFAHELRGRAELFPRLLTEVSHTATGIDIHPGAQIGAAFAIDHGTGVVIGETSEIGDRVRLYQGVTLGAARVSRRLEQVKRHPTIGDDVVIYANATILGGETVIGHGSRIGGNVWLTHSVPPFSVVTPTTRVDHRGAGDGATDDLIEFNI
jgi:serine O-acetyltransferase